MVLWAGLPCLCLEPGGDAEGPAEAHLTYPQHPLSPVPHFLSGQIHPAPRTCHGPFLVLICGAPCLPHSAAWTWWVLEAGVQGGPPLCICHRCSFNKELIKLERMGGGARTCPDVSLPHSPADTKAHVEPAKVALVSSQQPKKQGWHPSHGVLEMARPQQSHLKGMAG